MDVIKAEWWDIDTIIRDQLCPTCQQPNLNFGGTIFFNSHGYCVLLVICSNCPKTHKVTIALAKVISSCKELDIFSPLEQKIEAQNG